MTTFRDDQSIVRSDRMSEVAFVVERIAEEHREQKKAVKTA